MRLKKIVKMPYDYKNELTNNSEEQKVLLTVLNKYEYRTWTLNSKHSDPNTLESINHELSSKTFGLSAS